MILYMILKRNKDGTYEYKIGGGSSTPARPKIYDSLPRARAYVKNRPDMQIRVVHTDNLPHLS